MKSKGKTELVAAYIGALGMSAIRVMVGKSGVAPSRIEIQPTTEPVQRDEPDVTFETFWFAKAQHAELVIMNCRDDLRTLGAEGADGWVQLSAATLRDYVVNVAAGLGARWRTTAEIGASAEGAIDELERHVEALNKSGGLGPLNARYKAYRLAMQKTGEAAINYSAYLQVFKVRVVALVGKNVAAGAGRYDGFAMIVPSLVLDMDRAVRELPALRNTMRPRADRLSDAPLHHTRNDVHRVRRLKA